MCICIGFRVDKLNTLDSIEMIDDYALISLMSPQASLPWMKVREHRKKYRSSATKKLG